MKGQWFSVLRRWRGGALLAGLLLLLGILTPSGEVTVRIGPDREGPWPQFRVIPSAPRPGDPVIVEVQDRVPWGHILLTVNGEPAALERIEARPELMLWRWVWRFPMPAGSHTAPSE